MTHLTPKELYTAEDVYQLALQNNRRYPELEHIILAQTNNIGVMFYYARDIIKGCWPEAEPIIAQFVYYSYYYAVTVIQDRFPLGELQLLIYPDWAYRYARDAVKGRWIEAEPIIAKSPIWACEYAMKFLKRRWIEAEPVIFQSPYADEYREHFNIQAEKVNWTTQGF